ncbi:MAG: putative hydrolase or acyltransferase of alpha/beta superfamily, partial [Modestobacter sp.]|nr:putative hydrolase or acyltransferase of alpha/beta superfamily [Modestobacter sp.]
LVDTSAGDLRRVPRTRAQRLQQRIEPGVIAFALARAKLVERLRRLSPPSSRTHQKMVRGLLYGADATDAVVLRGAEIMHASSVRAFVTFYPALGDHEKRDGLAALTGVPVEVLVGEEDKLTPVRHSRQLAEVLPDAVLHVEPRCGHMLPQERPELVAAALRRLLTAAVGARVGATG